MADFFWKRNDTSQIQTQLKNELGQPVDVTGSTVTFIMKAPGGGSPQINAAATLVTPATGIVGYKPATSTLTSVSGTFNAEWQVVFGDGTKQTFPNDSYDTVLITDDLDNA